MASRDVRAVRIISGSDWKHSRALCTDLLCTLNVSPVGEKAMLWDLYVFYRSTYSWLLSYVD